ncbi:MAG: EamA family transporter RarD [Woeseia sp.]|nr:EamA family transporter RarD [Woeseia sp.]NNL53799.1 EamA family transporter RarD [Woeseia sp.]
MPPESQNDGFESPQARRRNGVISALIAFGIWGFLPIYFKILQSVPAGEVLAHRIVWSVPFGALIIAVRSQWPEVWRVFRSRKTFGLLSLSAFFIALNWLVYVWAVQNSQIFQASLGYYINPLMYVVIGVWFFQEQLRPLQIAAVVLAAVGVAVLTISGGQFPWISITLAISFTIYGVVRKRTDVGGMPGLFTETLILAPFAIGYLGFLVQAGVASFNADSLAFNGILILAGPFTVVPLLCFALAARRLNLSTIGIMQFIAPTLQFLVGVGYGEALTLAHIICFTCIWIAVIAFSWDAWRRSRPQLPASVPD